jgi:hypothetical protein
MRLAKIEPLAVVQQPLSYAALLFNIVNVKTSLFRSYTLANPDAHAIGSPTEGPGKQVSSDLKLRSNFNG